jgi:phage tail sheath gpL-like
VTLVADTDFDVGVDDDATATNLAAAINEDALLSTFMEAEAAAAVVTMTALEAGTMGNAITISSADATIVASGTHLEDGSNGTEKTFDFHYSA